jgi:dTDP-4-dehydrorhamnose reductase
MEKMIRVISGEVIDLFLDIRIGSPTYGYIGAHRLSEELLEWIYVPEGFAHGIVSMKDSVIEYLCTSEYSGSQNEGSINVFDSDINWDLCDDRIKEHIFSIKNELVISDRDRNNLSLQQWKDNENSQKFIYALRLNNIIVTGGSGLLGTELKKILIADYPIHNEFDLCDYSQMDRYLSNGKYKILLHCAAFASPPKVELDPIKGVEMNIVGTANVVKLCSKYNIKLIYVSTDYVFDGKQGNYKEDDPVNPINKYAISKLGGECCVKLYNNSLIIRLSFGPNIFPYEGAYVDQYTSRESVSTIAKKIVELVNGNIKGIIHIGHQRRSVYEYAKSLNIAKNIKEISVKDSKIPIPLDTSLNLDKINKCV